MRIKLEKGNREIKIEKSIEFFKYAIMASSMSSLMAVIAKIFNGTQMSLLKCLMPTYMHGVFMAIVFTVLGFIKLSRENNL